MGKMIWILVAAFVFLLSEYAQPLNAGDLGISAKIKGAISGTVKIENAKGEINFSLFTLTGDKVHEKKVLLSKKSEFVFSGCKASAVYIIEAEGDLTIEGEGDPVAKRYSKAMKVTTDDRGSAAVSFGD